MIRLIPLNDRVAVVVCLAGSAETLPEIGAGEWARDQSSVGFVEDGVASVYPLHHLCIANRGIDIGRHHSLECNTGAIKRTSNLSDALKTATDIRLNARADQRLDGCGRFQLAERKNARLRPLGLHGRLHHTCAWRNRGLSQERGEPRRGVKLNRSVRDRVAEHLRLGGGRLRCFRKGAKYCKTECTT
jgi:hypothetical protein